MMALFRKVPPDQLFRDAARRSTGGKRGLAPCGHPGEAEFANYFRCLHGCDGEAVPEHVAPEKTECLHRNTGLFFNMWHQRVTICLDCRARL